jgi:sulfhydrogenase subunit alpha
MHTTNLDLSLEEISKIEGTASVEIKVRDGIVTECLFSITEMRRFFTQAIRGKSITAVPQQVARVCGTCSNAHLLASVKAIENAMGIRVSPQTELLRQLLYYGLIIRDHALHLYIFSLPDVFHKDSLLAFDENVPDEHRLLDNCFAIKDAGNKLSIAAGGRSVHAPFVKPGGFIKIPPKIELEKCIPTLEHVRGDIIHLISVFEHCPFTLHRSTKFLAYIDSDYSFLKGKLTTDDGQTYPETDYENHLTKFAMSHSQASGFRFNDTTFMVGALARMNLNKDALHHATKRDCQTALYLFPSTNIYHNNLAQAIEILHAIDASIDLIKTYSGTSDASTPFRNQAGNGIGMIEAPRGMLYHSVTVDTNGIVKNGNIIVPTAQNQISIQESIREYVSSNLDKSKAEMEHEIEAIIRAYDPCMSCATHFLKFKWD